MIRNEKVRETSRRWWAGVNPHATRSMSGFDFDEFAGRIEEVLSADAGIERWQEGYDAGYEAGQAAIKDDTEAREREADEYAKKIREHVDKYHVSLCDADVAEAYLAGASRRRVTDRERAIIDAAIGLCRGFDWNNGTHAKHYRPLLEAAVRDVCEGREG